ncbi:VRR-NUC domain-containing protein [Aquabacterium sp. A7-Y]|uniref:VRR-NUC domain-containing protein n=1 Tax=Aquabacterium sp. A7-Y TaxID=1349605 RepID=UPI00223DBC50|nr:VRR-NUC domain-containing protein [Aquabacterium sp. A7-Y]MCW7538249.1 VRR-NUC domain-containing protein [Aquabacterium sp. A7-Y]
MTDQNRGPFASGGMSKEGTTTVVNINEPELDYVDKKVVCSAICKCKDTPDVGKDGRSLKQACVSGRLKVVDQALQHRSPYKPEVNYDMTKEPPAPIMDSSVETKGHDWLPGWIKKWWAEDPEHPPFQPGQGMIRRPDVVIVKDPTKPPTQDNIKQVVEVKFPPDTVSQAQKDDYKRIAGDVDVVTMTPDKCDCDKPEPDQPKIPVEDIGTLGAIGWLLMTILGRKPPRGPVPQF